MEADIADRIRADFSPDDAAEAIKLLEEVGSRGRIARCIVVASQGNLKNLRRYVEKADLDARDVISAGEYDSPIQKRDLRASFLIDSPEKFWIGGIAAEICKRGYFLRSLESRSASDCVSGYIADRGEGLAEFDGEPIPITIEKSNGQLILHGDADELELYDLNRPYDDECKFKDAVSCYILAKQRPNKALDDDA